jgi:general secretion pathway protein M
MINRHSVFRYLAQRTNIPPLTYFAVVIILCSTTLLMVVDIVGRYGARNAALETLTQLGERTQRLAKTGEGIDEGRPAGSPLLEGQSITLASAALLQRVTSAITRAGGSVVSSEIEPQGHSKDGFVKAVTNFELNQVALQQLLYDIEAGMPFLYIDQLSIHAAGPANDDGRLRVVLGVSGFWRGEK